MTNHDRSHYDEEPHDVSRPLPHHPVPYMTVFGALVVLTIITVLVGIYMRIPAAEIVNVLIALAIAAVKASLVALFFMHLKFEGKLVRMIFIVPLLLCVLLVVALLPDIVMTHQSNTESSSLKLFNTPALMRDIQE
jgi:cytochrome c oxidase subunit 4